MAQAEPMNWVPIIATASGLIGGGLAGSIFSYWIQWFRRPRLNLAFDKTVEGCEVETGTVAGNITTRYMRIKVLNTGRSTASNVSINITRIRFTPMGGPPRDFGHEVLDLKLAMTGEVIFRIAPEGHRFVDLCFTLRSNGAPAALAFDFARNPMRLKEFGFGPGEYAADVFASADATKPRRAEIKWSWDGTFGGLHAISVGFRY